MALGRPFRASCDAGSGGFIDNNTAHCGMNIPTRLSSSPGKLFPWSFGRLSMPPANFGGFVGSGVCVAEVVTKRGCRRLCAVAVLINVTKLGTNLRLPGSKLLAGILGVFAVRDQSDRCQAFRVAPSTKLTRKSINHFITVTYTIKHDNSTSNVRISNELQSGKVPGAPSRFN